jgi:hypothetical protein
MSELDEASSPRFYSFCCYSHCSAPLSTASDGTACICSWCGHPDALEQTQSEVNTAGPQGPPVAVACTLAVVAPPCTPEEERPLAQLAETRSCMARAKAAPLEGCREGERTSAEGPSAGSQGCL